MATYTAKEVREKNIKLKIGDSIDYKNGKEHNEPAILPSHLHFAGKEVYLGENLEKVMKTYYTILIWKESDEYKEGIFRY